MKRKETKQQLNALLATKVASNQFSYDKGEGLYEITHDCALIGIHVSKHSSVVYSLISQNMEEKFHLVYKQGEMEPSISMITTGLMDKINLTKYE
jgi:hypothetical protein